MTVDEKPEAAVCGAKCPTNPVCWCALNPGHNGPHDWESRRPAVACPCAHADPDSGALCQLPAGHDGAHQAPGRVWEAMRPIPPLSEKEEKAAAKRRASAKKGAETVNRGRKPAAKHPAERAEAAPAPVDNGRPCCPKCGKNDRILLAGEGGLTAPMERVGNPTDPELQTWKPRPLKMPDDAFCDRCMRWCGIPLDGVT